MDYIGFAERWGRYMLRPSLHMLHCGPRAVEEVQVFYPLGYFDPIHSAGSTATITWIGKSHHNESSRSRYIRVLVCNFCGFPAHRCKVFVDRVILNGKVIETERSPLHWMDLDSNVFEYPNDLRYGRKYAQYVDVCAADSIDPRLQLISLGATKGRHRYEKPGTYSLELTAEATKPCSSGHITLHVFNDGKDWKQLKVVSVESGRKWSRFW